MRYGAEWGVGGLIVFGVTLAFWSIWESEESSKKRLLLQKQEAAIDLERAKQEAATDLERATRLGPKLQKKRKQVAKEQVDKEIREEEAREKEESVGSDKI